jgi:hypothetical protein
LDRQPPAVAAAALDLIAHAFDGKRQRFAGALAAPPGDEAFHAAKVSKKFVKCREPLPELLVGPPSRHGIPRITQSVEDSPNFHSNGVEQTQSVPIVSNVPFRGGDDIHAGVLTNANPISDWNRLMNFMSLTKSLATRAYASDSKCEWFSMHTQPDSYSSVGYGFPGRFRRSSGT